MSNRAHEIKIVPRAEIRPNPKNRNEHTAAQVDRLVKIIEYQGFRNPLIVSNRTGLLVAGHGRLMAASKMGIESLPVIFQDFDSEEQEIAAGVSDNAIASWAELDLSGINTDLGDLGPDFDIDLLGIKNFKIDVAENAEGEDEVPVLPIEPKSKLGDIYRLGSHRLMCGDSTSIDAFELLMAGEKAEMVFTSPPYNGNTRFNPGKGGSGFGGGKNLGPLYENDADNKTAQEYIDFTQAVLSNCFAVLEGFLFWNVNYNSNSRSEFIKQIVPYLDLLTETICWKKTALPVPHGLTRTWEPIFVFSSFGKDQRIGHPNKTEFNYWEISNSGALDKSHRAAFPVGLPEKGIELCDPKTILDPFGGSGTTMIAAEKLGRKSFLMELDPKYCDVIVSRWEKFTGKKAELLTREV